MIKLSYFSYFGYRTKLNSLRRGLMLVEIYNAVVPKVNNYYEWGTMEVKYEKNKNYVTFRSSILIN